LYLELDDVRFFCTSPSRQARSESAALLDELLPAYELVLNDVMALLEIRTIIVSWLVNELMVLEHLLRNKLWQEAFVLLSSDLCKIRLLASGCLQARSNLLGRVVVLDTEYVLVQCRVAVLEDTLDEFAFVRAVSRVR